MTLTVMKNIILIGTVLGFAFSAFATYQWRDASYFLLPTRAWEMMLGGVAYLFPANLTTSKKKLLEGLGLVLIVASYFFIGKKTPWPGYLAFVPVFGAFLIIQAQCNTSFITGNVIFQKLGSWSYSIYLWHWPVVVAIYFYSLDEMFIYIGLALSVLLGFLSYTFIEKIKFNNNFSSLTQYLTCKPVYLGLAIGLVGFSAYHESGFSSRYSGEYQLRNNSAIKAVSDWVYPSPNLNIAGLGIRFIKGNSDKNILFIGASHVEQTYPYVKSLKSDYNVYYLTTGGCFLTPTFVNPKWSCSNIQNYKTLVKEVKFDKIVTSLYSIEGYLPIDKKARAEELSARTKGFDEFLLFAKNHANKVYLVLGEPKGDEFDPKLSVRHNLKTYVDTSSIRKLYKSQYQVLDNLKEIKDVVIIDPIDSLCDKKCLVMDKNYNYFYKDSNHMRPWYAIKNQTYLQPIFDK